ncbi:MAG: hypothetical protein V3W14_02230, partial [Candidatus Neomarinimicrobiota bacterium]
MNSQIAALQLFQTRGVGSRTFSRILMMLEHQNQDLLDFVDLSVEELVSTYKLSYKVAESLQRSFSETSDLADKL